MRTPFVFAFVFLSGCSLIWDMDPYEGGARSRDSRDGGGGGGGGGSSGTNGEAEQFNGGDCTPDQEPNNSVDAARELPNGLTCSVVPPLDPDYFKVTATGDVSLKVELLANVQLTVTTTGTGSSQSQSQSYASAGMRRIDLAAGEHVLLFEAISATPTPPATGGYGYAVLR